MNRQNVVTVLTPTYNRARLLKKLYQSLVKQEEKKFDWAIVDDGSNDNTEQVVKEFQEQDIIPIAYYKKENGGKHTALNYGISRISSDLVYVVDSDDVLTVDAVKTILQYHEKYKDNRSLCGYSFLRRFPDGKINGKLFFPDERIGTYIDVRINGNDMIADKAEVFRVSCMKEYPFPEIPGERFLGEDIVWIRMAKKYQMVHINKVIYVGSYLDEGLTNNRRVNNIKSPCGCAIRAKEFMQSEVNKKFRIKGAIQYCVYSMFAQKKVVDIIRYSNKKLLTLFSLPGGALLYFRWKRKYIS